MPTTRPTTFILLLTTLLAHLIFAIPTNNLRSPHPRRSPDLSRLALPTNPSASTPLPPVPAGLTLKHVALGVGTQNYTCATATNTSAAVATPASAGALASLYDIGPFLTSPLGSLFANALPPLALAMYGALAPADRAAAWTNLVAQMPGAAQWLADVDFGEHFFAEWQAALTPTWALAPSAATYPDEARSIVVRGKKAASADAPADACRGLDGEGAVPWLLLAREGDVGPDGIEAVFRVVTAGGMQPDTCEGEEGGEFEVKYAAEYWFYGK